MSEVPLYICISRIRKRIPLGPYRRSMRRVQGGSNGGWALSYGQGTPKEGVVSDERGTPVNVYLAHKKTHHPRTLPLVYA